MKKLLVFLISLLVLSAGMLYLGLMPVWLYDFVDTYAPAQVSDAIRAIGGERENEANDMLSGGDAPSADLEEEPAVSLPDAAGDASEISRSVIRGVLEHQEAIVIPVALPDGDDADTTEYFLREMELAIDIIRREAPEIFWISLGSYQIEWSGRRESREGVLTVHLSYCHPPVEVERMSAYMGDLADELVATAPSDPAEAAGYFHDWIVDNARYDSDLSGIDASMRGYEYGFNIDGVFMQGKAVCEGYTKAFKLLCDRAGIPCLIVFGRAAGENHSWNYVLLDGDWYLVDATWDDPVSEQDILLRDYFLKGGDSEIFDSTVAETYIYDDAGYPPLAPKGYYE